MQYLERISELVLSPMLLLGLGLAVAILVASKRSPLVPWATLGGVMFAASLFKYADEWTEDSPPFVGPLERIVSLGRPITIAGLVLLLLIGYRAVGPRRTLPLSVSWLLVAQYVLAIKLLIYGDMAFGLLQVATLTLNMVVFVQLARSWIKSSEDVDYALFGMATCAAIFCAVNAVQYVFNPAPLFAAHSRLNGTTGNAQHAAALLGGTLPSVLYFVATGRTLVRAAAALLAIGCLVLLVWTGSRTGLVMGVMSVLFVLRSSLALRGYAVVVGIVVLVIGLPTLFDANIIERFGVGVTEDTRSAAWAGMWQGFSENPIFGAALSGERLGFGESSWLAMASSAGIIGLVPLLAFGASLVSVSVSLLVRPYAAQRDRARRDATLGCIASLLVGSIFEAYLLGTLGAPVYLTVLACIMGRRMLTSSQPWQAQMPHAQPAWPASVDMRP